MALRFYAPTEEHAKTERTKFAAAAAAAQKSVVTEDADGLAANDYVCLGKDGLEGSEMGKIASISSQTLTMSANLGVAHDIGDLIIKFLFNQRKLYRSSTADGTYALVGSAVDIEVDNSLGTLLEDPTGSSSYFYKVTYFNSTSNEETLLADAVAVQGGGGVHYTKIGDVRAEAGFSDNYNISDATIDFYRTQAESEIQGAIAARYSLPLSEVPGLIENIAVQLAAGLLLMKEYGEEAEGTNKEGKGKVEAAREALKRIREGSLLLIDSTGSELPLVSTGSMAGFPDDGAGIDRTTQADKNDPVLFEIGKVF